MQPNGDRVGRYRLIEILGQGGFGVVWRAEQTEPVRREVALKVIKPGMDSQQVLARFEAERQALAVMDHACIAKVFDGGVTDRGSPYFVMELVKGEPITEFCDRHKLSITERVGLFIDVCEAVQHAHMKGVIHRDLKPGNILVTYDADGEPQPRVIDFGIAKALSQRLTEQTIFTEQGQMIGTPEYMSPEQAEMSGLDIDTRSDVYSLGVLLYELLTGALPFDPKTLRAAGFAEIQRIIREVDPPKPSTKLSTALGIDEETRKRIIAVRAVDLRELTMTLKRDLDWVVMRCLEKERSRRYDTASDIGDELRRYLNHEPVQAGPPSAAYRMRKFVRRNRAGVIVSVVIGSLFILGSLGTATGLVLTSAANRDLSEQQAATNRELQRATEVKSVMSDMLQSISPEVAELADTSLMLNILRGAERRLESGELSDPLIRAELHVIIGRSYMNIGHRESAARHLPMAARIRERELGRDNPDTLVARTMEASLLFEQERYEEAAIRYEGVLEDRGRVLGEQHPLTAAAMHNLSGAYRMLGRFDESVQLSLDAIERVRALGDAGVRSRLMFEAGLGICYADQGKFVESEELFRRLLVDLRETQGENDPLTINAQHELGAALVFQGRLAEAIAVYRVELDLCHRVYGELHPFTVGTVDQLAQSLLELDRFEESEAVLLDRIGLAFRGLDGDHPIAARLLERIDVLYSEWAARGGGALAEKARAEWAALRTLAGRGGRVESIPLPIGGG